MSNSPIMIPTQASNCGKYCFLNKETGESIPWYCGSRRCLNPNCAARRHYKRVRILQELVDEYSLTRFFTLTIRTGQFCTPWAAWCAISHMWSKMRKRLKRIYPDLKFVAVLEAHKTSGYPHIHGFCNQYIPRDIWVHHWVQCGGGYIVDVRAVKDEKTAAEYLSKGIQVSRYVGKQQLEQVPYIAKGQRTLWRSKGLKSERECAMIDRDSSEWELHEERIYDGAGQQIEAVRPDRMEMLKWQNEVQMVRRGSSIVPRTLAKQLSKLDGHGSQSHSLPIWQRSLGCVSSESELTWISRRNLTSKGAAYGEQEEVPSGVVDGYG